MIFVVRCRHCGNSMRYQSPTRIIRGKRKRCVFCGRSFEVAGSVIEDS